MSNLWETFYVNTETRYIGARQFRRYNAIIVTEDGVVTSKLSGSYIPCFSVYVKSLSEITQYSKENRLDNIENDIVNINTKVTNNYNINQINKKNIDFKTGIIDNQITAINSTLNDLETKNNNSKYSIENFFIYNIEIENTYTLNSDIPKFSIFNYDLEDDFKKDSILEINTKLLYDYTGYDNIGKLIHNYKLYDSENILFHEYKSLKTNASDNLKDDLHQGDIFYVKLNKDYIKIKIELILAMKEGATGSVTCKLYNTFNSDFLCIKYIKKN